MKKALIYHEAYAFASEIVSKLSAHCERIDIAGSLRREKQTIGDIEICCLPKKETVQESLFSEVSHEQATQSFIDAVKSIGKITKGSPLGRYVQIETELCQVDIFIPQESDYIRQYTIRVGSADYSHYVIAAGWREKGWVGTENGLRKKTECIKTSSGWKCVNECSCELPPVFKTELEFFNWLGIKYAHPTERSYNRVYRTE